jgi:hypothetical protein
MTKSLSSLLYLCSVASVAVMASSGAARADNGWLGFRNDTNAPVIVQGVSIINRVARQGPRHVLQPGQESWDVMIAPGNKLILIADAKQPTRMLLQETVNYAGASLFFSIQTDANGAGQNPNGPRNGFAVSKLKLTNTKAKTTPPPGGGIGVPNPRR